MIARWLPGLRSYMLLKSRVLGQRGGILTVVPRRGARHYLMESFRAQVHPHRLFFSMGPRSECADLLTSGLTQQMYRLKDTVSLDLGLTWKPVFNNQNIISLKQAKLATESINPKSLVSQWLCSLKKMQLNYYFLRTAKKATLKFYMFLNKYFLLNSRKTSQEKICGTHFIGNTEKT